MQHGSFSARKTALSAEIRAEKGETVIGRRSRGDRRVPITLGFAAADQGSAGTWRRLCREAGPADAGAVPRGHEVTRAARAVVLGSAFARRSDPRGVPRGRSEQGPGRRVRVREVLRPWPSGNSSWGPLYVAAGADLSRPPSDAALGSLECLAVLDSRARRRLIAAGTDSEREPGPEEPGLICTFVVGGRGFEPLTPSASRRCSTPELTARRERLIVEDATAPGRDRAAKRRGGPGGSNGKCWTGDREPGRTHRRPLQPAGGGSDT